MSFLPENARVIEWPPNEPDMVAVKFTRDGPWRVATLNIARSEEGLAAEYGLKPDNYRVLATFPDRTLEELVGNARAFQFLSIDRTKNPYLTIASTDDSTRRPWSCCGIWYTNLRALQDDLDIDLSTVVPLVPQES